MKQVKFDEQARTSIDMEWNFYNEGFRMFAVNNKKIKKMPGLKVNRVNESIWNMNKALNKVSLKKVKTI